MYIYVVSYLPKYLFCGHLDWPLSLIFLTLIKPLVDSGDHAVQGVGLWPLGCWNCEFELRQRRGVLSHVCVFVCVCVCVVRCQVDNPATGRSHIHRSPTECDVSEFDREASTRRWPSPTRPAEPWRKGKLLINKVTILISKAKNALAFPASSILTGNFLVLTKLLY